MYLRKSFLLAIIFWISFPFSPITSGQTSRKPVPEPVFLAKEEPISVREAFGLIADNSISKNHRQAVENHYAFFEQWLADFQKENAHISNPKRKIRRLHHALFDQFFKTYQKQPNSFLSLMEKGEYNCLSSTFIYAVALKSLGFRPHIHETIYHTFITLSLKRPNDVLIETTDKAYGLTFGFRGANESLSRYFQPAFNGNGSERVLFHSKYQNLHNIIDLGQLAALQHYNKSIAHFNAGNYEEAQQLLQKAEKFYPNKRITYILELIDSCTEQIVISY